MRTYAWGSRTAIAEFTGAPSPTAHPEAELWFGAHPGDPAWLQTDDGEQSLLDALRADPEGELGPVVRGRFGDTLPFLLKVLAADEPLSLQAHPSTEQAIEGFAREDRMGLPVSAPTRNYRDRSHKPELLVALSRIRGAGRLPARGAHRRVDARAGARGAGAVREPAVRAVRRRRPARAVHHVDHLSAAGSRQSWCPRSSTAPSPMCAPVSTSSPPRPGPCSNSASAIRATRVCSRRCC